MMQGHMPNRISSRHRRPFAACFTLALSIAALAEPHESTSGPVRIATADAQLEVASRTHAPQVVSLAGPNQPAWKSKELDNLPDSIERDGKTIAITWQLQPSLTKADAHQVVFVYESAQPHLRLSWKWQARASFGPVEHSVEIENLSERELWLPMVDTLSATWQISAGLTLHNFYVEKGADTPSPQGTHLDAIGEGYRWSGRSTTYARPTPGEAREIIPANFVFGDDQAQSGWFAGIEFSGRTRIALERDGGSLKLDLGLDPDPGPYRTRLGPGEVFESPTVFLGAFIGGPDGAGNQLRPWVRAVLNNPLTWKDPQYPLMVNNSWGSGMQVDESLALRMIADSKELGLEMFHIDAGWFRGVGDWYPNPAKFPHGLGYIADQAHQHGLRFGIWTDWTQAGLDTDPGALNVQDPQVRDWLVADVPAEWRPEPFKGQTIDIGVPAARDYAAKEVKRIVESYHLDMLEHDGYLVAKGCTRVDHPHAPPVLATMHVTRDWGSDFVLASNSTDVSYHAVRAYYEIYERLRREHPGLLLEICNDGGRMVDFGSAAHGDYFSITDTYDPLSNRRAFFDASHVLPAAMLESYIEKWPTASLDNFRYMLRSGMMGWTTLMLDTTTWSPAQHHAARQLFQLYKQRLRPLIRDASLYHVSPRPDGIHWDGIEYWDPSAKTGVVFAFRGSIPDEPLHRFSLKGLDPQKRYQLHCEDGSAADAQLSGKDLMAFGLAVHLSDPLSSELIFITESPQ
jgi:hypothetical protein